MMISNVTNVFFSDFVELWIALDDGFVCPKEKQFSRDGNTEAHPRYPHPDCQKFYICLNGVTPREHGCALGEVYNADTKQCDAPENVEDWYLNVLFSF